MKKTNLIILLIFTIRLMAYAQSCLPDGISFYSQESIDDFHLNYPNCTEIEGNVWVADEGITNVDGLGVLTSIGGSLEFWSYDTTINLTGLINLTTIGGDLNFYGTPLVSLSGLDHLTSIGRDLNIYECYELIDLSGLQNLTSVGRDMAIMRSNLSNLSGLGKLYSIARDFWIIQTNCINLSGLNNLTTIGRDFHIKSNYSLENLSGLSALTSIGGDMVLIPYTSNYGNLSLVNMEGLDNLITIGGNLQMEENNSLIDLTGLENLRAIHGYLMLDKNQSLSSLQGINSLDTLNYGLYLRNNPAIASISTLQNLSILGGYIWIDSSGKLRSLSGLENINPENIYSLILTGNDSLSTCEVESICSYLANPDAEASIWYNAPGCNSKEEVEQACQASDISESGKISNFTLSPNPAHGVVNISGNLHFAIINITFYNNLGQKVMHQHENTDKVDISKLEQGLYIVEIEFNNQKIRKKLIII